MAVVVSGLFHDRTVVTAHNGVWHIYRIDHAIAAGQTARNRHMWSVYRFPTGCNVSLGAHCAASFVEHNKRPDFDVNKTVRNPTIVQRHGGAAIETRSLQPASSDEITWIG